MAQIAYRINLSAKSFPLIAKFWGQTVIVPQYDNTFNRNLSSSEDSDRDVGIPQVYYMHNVFPNAQGFQSVGYTTLVETPGGGFTFSKIIDISGISVQRIWLGVNNSLAATYVYENSAWGTKAPNIDLTKSLTQASVNGRSLIYSSGQGAWEYKLDTRVFTSVTLAGLVAGLVDGICASFGYTIAWTKQVDASAPTVSTNSTTTLSNFSPTVVVLGLVPGIPITGANIPANSTIVSVDPTTNSVAIDNAATTTVASIVVNIPTVPSQVLWSSTIDPTDFVPSLITGAGGGAVEETKGGIVGCIPHTLGFFVFTTSNIVAAVYTNNARYPFAFREIVNSGGITNLDRITYDANTGSLYVYNSSGLQVISTTQAQTVFPEITDFLSANIFEDFNEATNSFVYIPVTDTMQIKLSIIADRYLIFSYGLLAHTHALVYDIAQKRFGKLKFTHVHCFEDFVQTDIISSVPRKSICLLTSAGKVVRVEFDYKDSSSSGVLLLGKYQYVRTHLLKVDELKLENIETAASTVVGIFSSLDGKTLGALVTGYLATNVDGFRKYQFGTIGLNHTVLVKGAFNITSGELVFHVDGKP